MFPIPRNNEPSVVQDFTSDDFEIPSAKFIPSQVCEAPGKKDWRNSNHYNNSDSIFWLNIAAIPLSITVIKRLQKIQDFENNSLNALNTLVGPESVEIEEVSEEGPSHERKFTVLLNVKTYELSFEGSGELVFLFNAWIIYACLCKQPSAIFCRN